MAQKENIRLQYITDQGCVWLEKDYFIDSEEGIREVIDEYVEQNQSTADALVYKWRTNGEDDVMLFPDVENISLDNDLFHKAMAYIDSK